MAIFCSFFFITKFSHFVITKCPNFDFFNIRKIIRKRLSFIACFLYNKFYFNKIQIEISTNNFIYM